MELDTVENFEAFERGEDWGRKLEREAVIAAFQSIIDRGKQNEYDAGPSMAVWALTVIRRTP